MLYWRKAKGVDDVANELVTYVKSNDMISAKYHSSLLENKLMAIALHRIEREQKPNGELFARFYPSELKELMSDQAHIYRDLKILSKKMTGHSMVIEDGKGNFQAFSVVPLVEYEDGIFTIWFSRVLQEHVFQLDGNFTTLELSIMTKFSKNSSFRIYELLKKDLYRSSPDINGGMVTMTYDLFEFRFIIGLANLDSPIVKSIMETTNEIDWEYLYNELNEKGQRSDIKYREPAKLKRDCLDEAQKELEEVSDIRFDYELIRAGKAYKRIRFHIYPNYNKKNTEVINDLDKRSKIISGIKEGGDYLQLRYPKDASEETQALYETYVGHNDLKEDDLDLFLKLAGMDTEAVVKAIEYTDKQEQVQNYVGYIVDKKKKKYYEKKNVSVMLGSAELNNAYTSTIERAHSKRVQVDVWEKTKAKEDFQQFLAYMEYTKDVSFDILDTIYEPGEAAQEYANWIRAGKP